MGVFKPTVQLLGSKNIGVLATFLVSGLYHEYILVVLDMVEYVDFHPNYSAQLFFFLWNGVALLVEGMVSQKKKFATFSSRIPLRIKNIFVVLTVLPIAHWFLDEYVVLGMFQDFGVAFPLIRRL